MIIRSMDLRAAVVTLMLAVALGCGSSELEGADAGDVDAWEGDPGDDPADYIFDETVIRTYEIELDPADWQWLNDNATLEEYRPATVRFEGIEVDDAALRFKGSYGSLYACFIGNTRICDKLSLKVSFNRYDPDGKFFGLKKLNFHGMERDPTRMKELIGYRLFRDFGVPASRAAYARLVVNGEDQGLFALIEQIDGRFTRARFEDGGEGNIYKEVWPVYTTEQPYLDALQSNRDGSPSADRMVRFAEALAAGGDEGFVDVIESWTDVDMLMRKMAVDRLIDHWDGIVAWYCVGDTCFNHNFYWYESTAEDRLWLIPWDLDNTFQWPSPIRTQFGMPDWDDTEASCAPMPIFFGIEGRAPACDGFMRGMVTGLWDRYAAATRELLDGAYSVAAMHARIDELAARIADEIATDPHGPTLQQWEAAVDELRGAVIEMRAYVETKL